MKTQYVIIRPVSNENRKWSIARGIDPTTRCEYLLTSVGWWFCCTSTSHIRYGRAFSSRGEAKRALRTAKAKGLDVSEATICERPNYLEGVR